MQTTPMTSPRWMSASASIWRPPFMAGRSRDRPLSTWGALGRIRRRSCFPRGAPREIRLLVERPQRTRRLVGRLLHRRLPAEQRHRRVGAEPFVALHASHQRMVLHAGLLSDELLFRVEDHLAFAVEQEGRAAFARPELRSEERRVGKSVDLGGRRIIKKKKRKNQ